MRRRLLGPGTLLAAALAMLCARAWSIEATLVADAHVNSARPAANSGAISNVNVGGGYTGLMQFDLGLLPGGLRQRRSRGRCCGCMRIGWIRRGW